MRQMAPPGRFRNVVSASRNDANHASSAISEQGLLPSRVHDYSLSNWSVIFSLSRRRLWTPHRCHG
jgi:hypothetical protein